MVYEEFLLTVQTALKSRLGTDYTVLLQQVPKNNGTVLDGLCITKTGDRTTPTIYLNSFYEKWKSGADLDGILEDMIHIYEDGGTLPNINPDILTDFTQLKDKVVYKLIHTHSNRDRLTDLPHIPYLDLSIVFYLFLEENELGHMTAAVHYDHMNAWKITEEGLYKLASRNTPRILPAEIKSMDEVIKDLISSQPDDGFIKELWREQQESGTTSPLYVLTNDYGISGSCAILYDGLLKNFADQLGQDLIILPSSVHEVLLVPYSEDINLEDLSYMVQYINLTEVPVEDRLSNEIYRYERSGNRVILISLLPEYQVS